MVAESEPQDMLAAMDQYTVALVSCGAEADLRPARVYTWRATVTVVSGTVAGGIAVVAGVRLWEPSMTFSEEVSPQSYQPAIGAWIPNRLESIIDTDSTSVPVIALYDPAAPASPRFTMDGPIGRHDLARLVGHPGRPLRLRHRRRRVPRRRVPHHRGAHRPGPDHGATRTTTPRPVSRAPPCVSFTTDAARNITGIVAPDPAGNKVLDPVQLGRRPSTRC